MGRPMFLEEIQAAMTGKDLYCYDDYSHTHCTINIVKVSFGESNALVMGVDEDDGMMYSEPVPMNLLETLVTKGMAKHYITLGSKPDRYMEMFRLIPAKKKGDENI